MEEREVERLPPGRECEWHGLGGFPKRCIICGRQAENATEQSQAMNVCRYDPEVWKGQK